jgi:predicted acyltransferase
MSNFLSRIRSIDAFRAVTMFLMIFVNDLDGIPNTPTWLKHAGSNVDALGLADTIFPAFLFIVGLSIPFAFQNRLKQGDNFYRLFSCQHGNLQ